MEKITKLSEFQQDALKEIGNIGIGHATTSLSRLVNVKVDISLPNVALVPILKLPNVFEEFPTVGIVLEMSNDTKGYFVFMLPKDSAKLMVKLVLGEAEEGDQFNEMEESVLKEMGNIMSGTYITALSNFLGMAIGLSMPFYLYDVASVITNEVVCLMCQDVEDVLMINTQFAIYSEKIDGKILIFTDSYSVSRLLEAINRLAEI